MEKKLQDKAWASLPEDFRREVREKNKEYTQEMINSRDVVSLSSATGKCIACEELFGRHNLTAEEKPRFKVGDKVRVIARHGVNPDVAGRVDTVTAVSGNFVKLANSTSIWREGSLEPYTEPAASECGNFAEDSGNSHKPEDKKLDLSELLKGCEGMEFYSPLCGKCTLKVVNKNSHGEYVIILLSKNGYSWCLSADGRFDSGELMLFPSKDCRTWEGWRPPRKRWKPKKGDTYYWFDSHYHVRNYCWNNDTIDNFMFTSDNCFRTEEQAKEAAKRVREVLDKYHDEIGE